MRVLVTEPIAREGIERLQSRVEVVFRPDLPRDELLAIIGDFEGLVVRSQTRVTAQVIEAATKLLVIARAGAGVDNIDVEAATRRGIVVVNAPTGNTIAAAEHTIALMLALARNLPQAHYSLKSGKWQRSAFEGVEVRNKILGIIGLGNVGSAVARRAIALEMKVVAYDPYVAPEHAQNLGVQPMGLEELLRCSDFVTIHAPLTDATRGLIGAKELAMLKPSARLINCARGGLVDENALFEAVEAGRLAGAAVDVFSQEPATDNILFRSDKILVTPHLAASTAEAQTTVALDIADQIIAVLEGRPARYAVNAPLVPPETLPLLAPYIKLCLVIGRLLRQLAEGQMRAIQVSYEGEIATSETEVLKAAVLGGLLEEVSEQRVNLVNANLIAQSRGLQLTEHKRFACENYTSLVTVEASTTAGTTTVSGTVLREQPNIVRVNDYWIDLFAPEGYYLFSHHLDRPGLIGAVGTIAGNANINISSMRVGRLRPRGQALMVLGLDEPLNEEQRQQILAIPDVYTAKLVRL
ncbi:MAG TPA: phosphoglycerate dehydrogenase [Dehalococcoidia bacterium]|nr:phosphoglycerate dehydrogenase [Dehalococcoidia bacterium]